MIALRWARARIADAPKIACSTLPLPIISDADVGIGDIKYIGEKIARRALQNSRFLFLRATHPPRSVQKTILSTFVSLYSLPCNVHTLRFTTSISQFKEALRLFNKTLYLWRLLTRLAFSSGLGAKASVCGFYERRALTELTTALSERFVLQIALWTARAKASSFFCRLSFAFTFYFCYSACWYNFNEILKRFFTQKFPCKILRNCITTTDWADQS